MRKNNNNSRNGDSDNGGKNKSDRHTLIPQGNNFFARSLAVWCVCEQSGKQQRDKFIIAIILISIQKGYAYKCTH